MRLLLQYIYIQVGLMVISQGEGNREANAQLGSVRRLVARARLSVSITGKGLRISDIYSPNT